MSEEDKKEPAADGTEQSAPEPDSDAEAKAAAAKAKAEAAAAARAKKAELEAAKPPWERDPQAPDTVDAAGDSLVKDLEGQYPGAVVSAVATGGDLVLEVKRYEIRRVCASLFDAGYRLLVDICGADYPQRDETRFDVVYHVYSLDENRRVRLKVKVSEDQDVPSVTAVWRGADWCEREVYDMYGVRFADHPDMTRILMWDGFHGHPLRKDFPVEGVDTGAAIYPEYYDDTQGPVGGDGTGWKAPSDSDSDSSDEAGD